MNDKNAFRYITDDPITLELTGCSSVGEVHECIKRTFGFPEYYGENWDAMWDCLTDVFLPETPRHILVEGFAAMPEDLQAYAQPMREIFRDLQEKYPWVTVTYR